jgi:hypothetical protein
MDKSMSDQIFPGGVKVGRLLAPPAGFDPLSADDDTLTGYGLPPRPTGDPKRLKDWEAYVTRKLERIDPIFEMSKTKRHGPFLRAQQGTETSNNWSGCVVYAPGGAQFKFIQATFTVPGVSSPTSDGTPYHCSSWVGIDGDGGSPDVFQVGVECEVTKSGGQTDSSFYCWWEWFPAFEVAIMNLPVVPGDEVYCWVYAKSTTSGIVSFTNNTTGVYTSFPVGAPNGTSLSGNCAEWVVERPEFNGALTSLPSYTEVVFQKVATQAINGNTVTHPTPDQGSNINMTDGTKTISEGTIVDASTVKCDYTGP